jgi:hypothetical protein
MTLAQELGIGATRLYGLIWGQTEAREEELTHLAKLLGTVKQNLIAAIGGILTISISGQSIGWARLDPEGRLSWGIREIARRKSDRKRLEAGTQYLARVIYFERPDILVFENRTSARHKKRLLQSFEKNIRSLTRLFNLRFCKDSLEKTKPRELAVRLLGIYPQLIHSMSLDPKSPALVFNLKRWRPVLIALSISHKKYHEINQAINPKTNRERGVRSCPRQLQKYA